MTCFVHSWIFSGIKFIFNCKLVLGIYDILFYFPSQILNFHGVTANIIDLIFYLQHKFHIYIHVLFYFQNVILHNKIAQKLQINFLDTCLKSKELFIRLNVSLKFTFYGLYHFDSIFIKNIEHVPNSQTLGIKTH
jgi:hypothetical protein